MAEIFVDSTKTGGADDGTSWTDAYLTLKQAVDDAGLAAGDIIKYERDHDESSAVSVSLGFADGDVTGPIQALAWDETADELYLPDWSTDTTPRMDINRFGSPSTLFITGCAYFYGMHFDVEGATWSAHSFGNHSALHYENCWFDSIGNARLRFAGDDDRNDFTQSVRLTECKISQGTAAAYLVQLHAIDDVLFEDIEYDASLPNPTDGVFSYLDTVNFEHRGGDLSMIAATSPIVNLDPTGRLCRMKFIGLKLNTAHELCDTFPPADENKTTLEFIHCQAGTLTDPPVISAKITNWGMCGAVSNTTTMALDEAAMTGKYRAGGAQDTERSNPISWLMTARGGRTTEGVAGIESFPIAAWLDGDGATAKTIKVHFAHDGIGDGAAGRVQNDQLWLDVYHQNDAAQDARVRLASTRVRFGETVADLADETDTWTGSGLGTKQSVSVSVTPDGPGPVYGVVTWAPGDATDQVISLDPLLVIT